MKTADHRMLAARLLNGPIHGRANRAARTLAGGEESGQGLIEQVGVTEAVFSPEKAKKIIKLFSCHCYVYLFSDLKVYYPTPLIINPAENGRYPQSNSAQWILRER